MSKQCKCEHWQQCPTCMPHRFGSDGELLPIPPTPLQAAKARIAELEKENAELAAQNVALREALEECLDDSRQILADYVQIYGATYKQAQVKAQKEQVARAETALNLPDLASEVLKRRDAEVLRRAADRFEAVDPHPKHWDWLRRNAAEIEGGK